MTISTNNDASENQLNSFEANTQSGLGTAVLDNRPTKIRIKIRIPKNFHEEPIISRLVAEHGITVNIAGALLGANARDDGWFDLELRGTRQQIQTALVYLQELDLEIWSQSDIEEGW